MSNDIVSRLEKKIDELLARQERLVKENERLAHAEELYSNERVRCRQELDLILSKLDQLS